MHVNDDINNSIDNTSDTTIKENADLTWQYTIPIILNSDGFIKENNKVIDKKENYRFYVVLNIERVQIDQKEDKKSYYIFKVSDSTAPK